MEELKFISYDCKNDNIALARRTFKFKFIKSAIIIACIEGILIFSLINMEKNAKNIIIMTILMLLGVLGLWFMYSSQRASERYLINNDKREYVSFTFFNDKIVGESKFSDNGQVVTKDYDYRLIRSFKEDDKRIYLKVSDTASLVINKENSTNDKVNELKKILRTKMIRVD